MSTKELEYAEYIKDYRYDPETGKIFSLPRKRNRYEKEVGWIDYHGYVIITINRRKFKAHRIAWYLKFGYFPKEIDHINRNKTDNRLCNLRECTRSQNKANTSLRSDNKSGIKGVIWHKKDKKWSVYITKNGKQHYGGGFLNIEDAAKAAEALRIKLFGEFANA